MVLPAVAVPAAVSIFLATAVGFWLGKNHSARQLRVCLNEARKDFRERVNKGELNHDDYNLFCDYTHQLEEKMGKENMEVIQVLAEKSFKLIKDYAIDPSKIQDLNKLISKK